MSPLSTFSPASSPQPPETLGGTQPTSHPRVSSFASPATSISFPDKRKLGQHRASTVPIHSAASNGFVPTADDRNNALWLMQQERQLKGKTHNKPFTSKESSPVLASIASGKLANSHTVTSGVVQVLLSEFGANLSVMKPKSHNIFKVVAGVDQNDIPHSTNLLLQALEHCDAEIVSVLLRYADASAKTKALPIAIQTNDPLKVQYVMASGADASPLCKEFQEVVKSGSYETLCALTASSKTRGPCRNCLDTALVQSVRQGSLRRTLALLDNGADITYQGSAALLFAVQNGSVELVDAMICFTQRIDKPVAVDIISSAAVAAYESIGSSKSAEANYKILNLCLAAGAAGPRVSQILISALRNGQFNLVEGFAKHQIPVYNSHDVGSAIVDAAVATGEPNVVRAILSVGNGPNKAQMKNGMTLALKLESFDAANTIAGLLLDSGLRGDHAVSEGLLGAIKKVAQCSGQLDVRKQAYKVFYGFVQLFLSKGAADVDFQGGESLVQAAAHGLQDILELLIRYQPSTASMTKAILPAMRVLNPARRHDIVNMLLNSGAQGAPVGEALTLSAGMGKDHIGLTALILPYSSVNFQGGKPLVSAVRSGCIDQIKMIIESGTVSSQTIAAAWVEIKTVLDDDFQMDVYKLFFKNCGNVDHGLCDDALVGAASLGYRGRRLCDLMLRHGGSPARLDGQSITAAAKSMCLNTLQLLSAHVSSPAVYTAAFDVLTEGPGWLMPEGLEIASFLLEKGASGKAVDSAFCQAASHHDLDAVELLQPHVGAEVLGLAIMSATDNPIKWPSSDESILGLINDLLEAGATSEHVNPVFLYTIESGQATEDIVETFMTVGEGHSNVNFQDGEALKMVIRQGNAKLLDHILGYASQMGCCASSETMTQAFAETLTTDHLDDETVIIQIINVLVKPRNGTPLPDFKALLPHYHNWAPMFACIQSHPNFPQLVSKLANLGCDMKAETYLGLYDDEDVEVEPANLLAWALCLTEENRVASGTIEALIDANADVNFTSQISAATPLILASKYGRGDIVAKLIAKKARVSARDCFDRSALFYASRIGDLEAVKALVKAKSRVNDGSLQEAARNLRFEAVEFLLKAGHHTNYPSSHECHDGRDALQELALMAQPTRFQAPVLEDTIRALANGKEKGDKVGVLRDPGALNEKNALFLALDNSSEGCWMVCRALLEIYMWKFANEPTNVYSVQSPQTGTQLFLSPTMYVRLGLFQGPEQQRDALLQLLARIKCQDRFYAELGAEQPFNAVGLPEEIAKAEAKRKAKEEKLREENEEHRRKISRKEHEEQVRSVMDQIRHDEKLLHQRQIEEQKRYQAELSHNQQKLHAADSHEQKLQLQAQMAQSQQFWAAEKAKFEETKKQRMNALAEDKLHREQQLKIDFEQRMTAQKLARQEQQSLLAQQEAIRKVQAQRNMQALKAKGEKQKLEFKKKQNAQTKKMLTAQTANKRTGHKMQMEKVHADQQTLRMKAALKYFDAKNVKRIGA